MELLGKHIAEFVKLNSGKNFLYIRHGQSLANYSGVLAGYTDTKMTVKGREEAHNLYRQLYKYQDQFTAIHSSDLSRAYDTANISLGFPKEGLIQKKKELRELYFGSEENLHYDSLADDRKDLINHIDYVAKDGEGWQDVRKRVIKYMGELEDGNYLVYSHGGVMCSLTWYIGLQDMLPNCSALGLSTDASGTPEKLLFTWEYPQEQEI